MTNKIMDTSQTESPMETQTIEINPDGPKLTNKTINDKDQEKGKSFKTKAQQSLDLKEKTTKLNKKIAMVEAFCTKINLFMIKSKDHFSTREVIIETATLAHYFNGIAQKLMTSKPRTPNTGKIINNKT